jgi:L-asparaginase
MPRVDVVMSYVGADGVMIDAAVAAGARGIVAAGTGAGRCTPAEDAALDRAVAAGVAVCQGSRVARGRVSRSPAMRARGLLSAEALVPWKARILLGLGLTQTHDADELHEYFTRF